MTEEKKTIFKLSFFAQKLIFGEAERTLLSSVTSQASDTMIEMNVNIPPTVMFDKKE